ncbi:hypothetical protein ACTID9_05045 [Brevibacillus fluminis]|uniref:hypothetical protein n=1 Tax=Brevibacillus fluminis TaxID=511487 RepID=UPI003F8AEEA4
MERLPTSSLDKQQPLPQNDREEGLLLLLCGFGNKAQRIGSRVSGIASGILNSFVSGVGRPNLAGSSDHLICCGFVSFLQRFIHIVLCESVLLNQFDALLRIFRIDCITAVLDGITSRFVFCFQSW